jgi:hypothetical protein
MITIIGDVHGKYQNYLNIVKNNEYTVQLGDYGFKYESLKDVNHNNHLIIGGNHDNMDKIINTAHYLGDYGYTELNGINFFYYRGAYSIDRQDRTIGINWWEQEQVTIDQFMKARELYREIKPDIVLTHDCPDEISFMLLDPNQRKYENITGWALQELFNIHQPKIWRFGHYHHSWRMTVNGTDFRCLDELEVENIS